jgi:hypothetical protein
MMCSGLADVDFRVLTAPQVRHVDPDSGAMDARTLVLHQIHEFGGTLSRHLSEHEQNAFDATCKKLYRFLCPS